MSEQLALLPAYVTAHLQLALVALLAGSALSLPLGILVTRRPSLEPGVMGVASVIQTIPSLALLAVMVPVFAAVGTLAARAGVELRGIGYLPAVVALTLYSVLPILRNTVTGITGVDPAVIEAARGVGMTARQRLIRVELPLAAPVIVAGLRTATVWVVGTATLSTPIGATSLGNFIFSGLATRNDAAVLMGCLAAAATALALDGLIRGLEVGVRDGRRPLVVAAGVALLALYAYTAASFVWQRTSEAPIAIGSKVFTEQYVLAGILAERVEARTGRTTRRVSSLGSTVAFDALVAGDIDLYVDYSGTIWATLMKREGLPEDREAVLREVAAWLFETHGVEVVAALGFENTYALAMRRDRARELGLATLGQLAAASPGLEIGGDYEFFQRAEWAALVDAYGFAFRTRRAMDPALMYAAVEQREVDVISAFSTDGRIAAFDLLLLDDELGVIPPYDAIVLARPGLAAERPDVVAALRGLAGAIDAAAMQRMNLAVDRDGRSPAEVAAGFLGTLPPGPGDGQGPSPGGS